MNIKYVYQGINFEWDSHKEESNLRKHGVSFRTACEAFLDPLLISLEDEVCDEELREKIIGMTRNWHFLYVVYLWKADDILRIISARPATKKERMIYENQ